MNKKRSSDLKTRRKDVDVNNEAIDDTEMMPSLGHNQFGPATPPKHSAAEQLRAGRGKEPRRSNSGPSDSAEDQRDRSYRGERVAVGERLQKVLAAAGLGSRRQCEELITTGRVEVDGRTVTQLGTRVDPRWQRICVDGEPIASSKLEYYAVNKPAGVVCTNRDPSGRPRVVDLVPQAKVRLFSVGRLDLNSEGLILLTNDGELTQRLTHPRYEVPKTYRVLVAGRPTPEVLARLKKGIHLAEGVARVEQIRIRSHRKQSTVLDLVLREGKNREVRRVLARVGHKVMRLTRLAVGPVKLGTLPLGQSRPLTRKEIDELRRAAGLR